MTSEALSAEDTVRAPNFHHSVHDSLALLQWVRNSRKQNVAPIRKPRRSSSPESHEIPSPIIPQDIINEILDHLASDLPRRSLRRYALISRSWVQPCRRYLFRSAVFTPANAHNWLKTFPVQEKSPAHYVRDLRIEIGRGGRFPKKFFQSILWFTDVDKIDVFGYTGITPYYKYCLSPSWEVSFCVRIRRSM